MRSKHTPEKARAIAADIEKGRSTRDIARDFGISEGTVRNWTIAQQALERDQARAIDHANKRPGGRFAGVQPLRFDAAAKRETPRPETNAERLQRAAAEQATAPELPPDERDTLTQIREMFRDSVTRGKEAQQIGHSADAQRFGRIAAVLVPVIARLERDSKADEHTLKISRQEIAERRLKVRQRFRAICDRPLLCSACSRKLSVFWGTGKTEEELPSA